MRIQELVWQFIVVAVLAWIPVLAIAVFAISWPHPATDVPSHWDIGGRPSTMSSSALFAASVAPAAVCASVATVAAVLLDASAGRWATASGLGVLVGVGAAVALQWPVAQLTAADPTLHNSIGSPFLLYCAAPLLGSIAFAVAAARRDGAAAQPEAVAGENDTV